jgi:nucleoside-triphosphatase
MEPPRILLEGRPGSGKTTVARRLAELLERDGVPVFGILTGDARESGRRVGFSIERIGGATELLAHVDLPGPPRVGRYGVDLEALERVALQALREGPDRGVAIVDELGKMELASKAFREAVLELLERPVAVVATAQAAGHPFTRELKREHAPAVERVTAGTRDELPARLAAELTPSRTRAGSDPSTRARSRPCSS